ncbi:hypothetical protein GIS00_01485 [Nakamurella sp. YIM 132087]|uniref:YdhG-like domain-containing protein n=1 Tax=Nakamurella alba TaxID=2665158 RepID=A0A7K1FEW6_9ACTN|nr:DUF1801 domain-containing protein [Nakamurella alba]MTD12616.1 hypothetical protein [Nakamurella alba]
MGEVDIDDLRAPLAGLVRGLQQILGEELPDATVEHDPGRSLIGYTYLPGTYKGLVAAIAVHGAHVNLMLSKGADLLELDEHGLLVGTGKKARHIVFRETDDLDRPGIRELIRETARRTPRA